MNFCQIIKETTTKIFKISHFSYFLFIIFILTIFWSYLDFIIFEFLMISTKKMNFGQIIKENTNKFSKNRLFDIFLIKKVNFVKLYNKINTKFPKYHIFFSLLNISLDGHSLEGVVTLKFWQVPDIGEAIGGFLILMKLTRRTINQNRQKKNWGLFWDQFFFRKTSILAS